jgi:hypothetical protein
MCYGVRHIVQYVVNQQLLLGEAIVIRTLREHEDVVAEQCEGTLLSVVTAAVSLINNIGKKATTTTTTTTTK